ncbi:MAG: M2 family metallopeptidase [Ignavibacteriaceae bacterium]|nr:M2 family metallopeptidase [Ignavibacteriaceae bacterium]
MSKQILLLFTMFLVSFIIFNCSDSTGSNAKKFVERYTKEYQPIFYRASLAQWVANTNITDENTQKEIVANKALSEFEGRKGIIDSVKMFLKDKNKLDFETIGQLEKILYNASHAPATIPQIVDQLINAEAKQTQTLYGFEFKLKDGQKVTANDIDNMLVNEMNPAKRLEIWEASKEIGKNLRDGLINLQGLRNKVAREMGYSSYFDLEVSQYGMKASEMKDWMQKVNDQLKPLYEQLYTWVKYKLAERYHEPVPDKIPAQWLPNRWGQEWPGIVEGINLDNMFKGKSPEWIVKQGEKFYVSMGMPNLPQTFWDKSDLYSLPADSPRKKNTHASAWHLDLDKDIRSLMNVEANAEWFQTVHHELGHTYYFMAYSTPEIPILLRDGLNPGFHEGMGELIATASMQQPYLKEIGLLTNNIQIDSIKWLLNEALNNVVFIPFATGTMSMWEYEFYENNLSKDQINKKWWELAEKYQGIVPPSNRGEEYCDASTKTHINDYPCYYYNYAVAKLVQYQLHNYISRNVLKQDPHNANYYNSKETGQYLLSILQKGKTVEWRSFIKEKTGEELNADGMIEYFKPLMDWLKKENTGRKIGW